MRWVFHQEVLGYFLGRSARWELCTDLPFKPVQGCPDRRWYGLLADPSGQLTSHRGFGAVGSSNRKQIVKVRRPETRHLWRPESANVENEGHT